MSNTFLFEAYLVDADLSLANLSGAELKQANISGARLFKGRTLGIWRTAGEKEPTTLLTQKQLDRANAEPGNPPQLNGVLDAQSGEPASMARAWLTESRENGRVFLASSSATVLRHLHIPLADRCGLGDPQRPVPHDGG